MPSTYNGIGTWYYGKQRVHRLKGSCQHCHSIGELESYDTTLYFVFFMIPIIPLKKKRVLESCPKCQMHRVIDLSQWEQGKDKAIAEIIEKLRQDPDNREVILEAIGMSTFFQDQPLFDKLATLAVDKTGDAEIQAALAAGYSYFSQRDKAIEAYKHSLVANDNPQVRRDLAINFLRMGEPEQAEPLLRHVWETPDPAGIGHVQLLVEAYRSQGKHQQALQVMDLRDAAFPEFAQHADVMEQRRTSQKNLASGKPIRSAASLADTSKSGYQEGSKLGSGLAKWIFPIILLGLFALYIGVAISKGNSRKVYFVNGTKTPYKVVVNGAEHQLPADHATPIQVPEGELDVKVDGLPVDPFRVKVETNFWGRPFDGSVFVVNPDRTAIVIEEEATYAENNPPVNPPPKIHFGQELYHLPNVDFEFENFPMQLKVKKGSRVTRSRIDFERGLDPQTRVAFLFTQNLPAEERVNYLKRMLALDPAEPIYLNSLVMLLPDEEVFAYLKPGLAKRPLQLEWHRAYQSLSERKRPDHDLKPEYEALVKETDSPDAKYLLGRILADDERAIKLQTEGANANPPSIYCQYALGYYALGRGKFEEAVDLLGKAYEQSPKNPGFQQFYRDALWAAGKYDRLEQLPAAAFQGDQISGVMQRMRIAAAKDDVAQAEQLKNQAVALSGQFGGGDPRVSSLKTVLEAQIAVIRGDEKGYLRVYAGQTDEKPFYVPLLEGKIAEAVTAFEPTLAAMKGAGRDQAEQLAGIGLLYLYARQADKNDIADKQFAKLIELLPSQGAKERQLGAMLAGKEPFDVKKVLPSRADPELKRVLLLVFAEKFPEAKAELKELAAKVDFQRDEISLCLRKLRDKK